MQNLSLYIRNIYSGSLITFPHRFGFLALSFNYENETDFVSKLDEGLAGLEACREVSPSLIIRGYAHRDDEDFLGAD